MFFYLMIAIFCYFGCLKEHEEKKQRVDSLHWQFTPAPLYSYLRRRKYIFLVLIPQVKIFGLKVSQIRTTHGILPDISC